MKVYCNTCGCLVAEIAEGSQVRKGTIYTCASCYRTHSVAKKRSPTQDKTVDYLKKMFGMN